MQEEVWEGLQASRKNVGRSARLKKKCGKVCKAGKRQSNWSKRRCLKNQRNRRLRDNDGAVAVQKRSI